MRLKSSINPLIVLVVNSLAGRGGERSVLTLANGFQSLGCQVHILYFSNKIDYKLNPEITHHLVNIKPYKWLVPKKLRYKQFAKKVDAYILNQIGTPNLILSNLNQPNLVMSFSQLKNLVYVIRNTFSQERNAETSRKRQKRIKFFAEALVKHPCVCISQGVADDLKTYLTPFISKNENIETHVIYNAFDAKEIRRMASETKIKKSDYLLHVGAFSYAKDHETLLRAYAKSDKKLPLWLLGKGNESSTEKIKSLVTNLNLQDNVVLKGFASNPYPFIKNAHGLILSSRYEGFGRVIMEAIILDTPVISTNCPSGPNELLPVKSLSEVGDVGGLSRQINRLIENPQQFMVSFQDKFLPENIAKKYLELFVYSDY